MVERPVAYVQVSSAEQNLDRQLAAVGECDRIFQDKLSGSSRAKRKGLAELTWYVREGDPLLVVEASGVVAAWGFGVSLGEVVALGIPSEVK